jgi:hypothetical protein
MCNNAGFTVTEALRRSNFTLDRASSGPDFTSRKQSDRSFKQELRKFVKNMSAIHDLQCFGGVFALGPLSFPV